MPPDPIFLATAIEAVLQAGALQLKHRGAPMRIEKKSAIDLVTEVDLLVEERFRQLVRERFGDHGVLAEEMGAQGGGGESRYCWIFDPIDGTTNYAHGLPFFCASLALEIDGVPAVAAVYNPVHRELFCAERGGGAYLNGRRLTVSTTGALVDALLCTGFPYDVHESADEIVGLFAAFVRRARAVRRLGSAALDLCYVAAGRLDGFWERRLKPWDTAAGALIVEEAGGRVSTFHGGRFSSRVGEMLASNGPLHDPLIETIAGFETARARGRTE